jgi:hypothetical protein
VKSRLALTTLACLILALAAGFKPSTPAVGAGSSQVAPVLQSALRGSATSRLGQVRAIRKGLQVQPPNSAPQSGKVKQSLYGQYDLQTQSSQRASLAFLDGSILQMNQRTNLVLASPHQTLVKQGEVDQLVVPGTNHQVKTASAVASAIGTEFDVRVAGSLTTLTVIEGAVLVTTPFGSVLVTTGQQTTIRKGHAPTPPVSVNAPAANAWDQVLPPPAAPLGTNVGLNANGGGVVAASSQRSSPGGTWDARFIDDGRLDRGWASASGKTAGEWVELGFGGSQPHQVTGIVLDCAATGGLPAGADLKDFTVRVSTDANPGTATFQTVLTGVCAQTNALQRFAFPQPVSARWVELVAGSTYGSSDAVSVAELEIVSTDVVDLTAPPPSPQPAATSTPTPTDTPAPSATETPVPTSTPMPTDTPVPTATASPTATATPLPVPTVPVPAVTQPAVVGWTFSAALQSINQFCPTNLPCNGQPDLTLQNPVMTGTVCSRTPIAAGWTGTIQFTVIDHVHKTQTQQVTPFGPAALLSSGPSRFYRGNLSYWDVSFIASKTIVLHQVFDVPEGTLVNNSFYADSSVPQMQTAYATLTPLTRCP